MLETIASDLFRISARIPSDCIRRKPPQVCAIYNMTPCHDGWNHTLFSIAILLLSRSRSFFFPFYTCTRAANKRRAHENAHVEKMPKRSGRRLSHLEFPYASSASDPELQLRCFRIHLCCLYGYISGICPLPWKLQFALCFFCLSPSLCLFLFLCHV